MAKWTVKLEGVLPGTEDDFILHFIDIREIMPCPIIERYIIQDILDIAPKKSYYTELPNVKEVALERKEILPRERIAVILATVKGAKEQIGLLLYMNEDLKYEVRGLRPDAFAKEVRKDKQKLIKMITKLGNEPEVFEDVNLVLPENRF